VKWTELEDRFSREGVIGDGSGLAIDVFRERVLYHHYRRAEALQQTQGIAPKQVSEIIEPIQKVRTLISRGKHNLAQKEISKIPTEKEDADLLLERARLSGLSGQWSDCESFASAALSIEAPGPTHLTIRQVRSLARYELGKIDDSLRDIDEIVTLLEVYPSSNSIFYARSLEVRCLAAHPARPDTVAARSALDLLWREQTQLGLDLDSVLTLLRIEADLRRIEGLAWEPFSLAGGMIARTLGDAFYEGLAWLDLSYSSIPALSSAFAVEAAPKIAEYDRLKFLCNAEQVTTSGRILKRGRKSQSKLRGLALFPRYRELERILLPTRKLMIDLKARQITALNCSDSGERALAYLADEKVDKSDLFSAVWPGVRYNKETNDATLRTLLKRLRAELGGCLDSEKGTVSLHACLVLV